MNELWWYVARGAGLLAWGLAMSSVALGVALAGRLVAGRGVRGLLLVAHRWVSAGALSMAALHVGAVVVDDYVEVGLLQALLPGASPYETTATALGAVSLWILVTVQLTSLARRQLSRRTWHGIHLLTYVAAVLMTVHALAAGTDAGEPALAVPMVAVGLVVAVLAAERLAQHGARRRPGVPPTIHPCGGGSVSAPSALPRDADA